METTELILNYFNIPLEEKKSPIEIPYTYREDLAKLFKVLDFKVGAEVGVYRGVFSEILCQSNPNVKHYCIDQYKKYTNHPKQEDMNGAEEEAMQRLLKYNVHFIKESSVEAAKRFEDKSLDYVYIDANHEYPYVVEDIRAWARKVRPGGIVAGHDYYLSKWPKSVLHVVQAVQGWTSSYKIDPWFVLGDDATVKKDWSKRYRTWFWVVR